MKCEDAQLESALISRLESRIDLNELARMCQSDIVVAGGAILASEPHDYDIYAARVFPLCLSDIRNRAQERGWKIVAETRNALTVQGDMGKVYQFCSYVKESPEVLIESFDFAHCQVGVVISQTEPLDKFVVLTDAFLRAMALQRTFFCGSEYPLSSLIRLVKYAQRGLLGDRRAYMNDMIRILTAVLQRGFYDHDDLRDQLNAIDLDYVGHEANELWSVVEKALIRPRPTETSSGVTDDFPF